AVYSAFVELLGGAALIAGLGLPVTGTLLFLDMAGAFVFVHADKGLLLVEGDTVRGGYELVLTLGMAGLLFAAGGGGRLTADRWITGRRLHHPGGTRKKSDEEDAADFVASLRAPEAKPPKKTRSSRAAKKQPSATEPAENPGTTGAPGASDESAGSTRRGGAGRTGADDGEQGDVLVAGRKGQRRRASRTQPIKRPGAGEENPS